MNIMYKVTYKVYGQLGAVAGERPKSIDVEVPVLPRVGDYFEFDTYTYKVKKVIFDDLEMTGVRVILAAER